MPTSEAEIGYRVGSSLVAGLTALAYIEDDSIILTFPSRTTDDDRRLIQSMPSDFAEFSKVVVNNLAEYRQLFKRIKNESIASGWVNSPPFQRMMREHWFWRWHELTEILKIAFSEEEGPLTLDLLSPLSQRYSKVAIGGSAVLIRSAVSFDDRSDEALSALETAFERFNDIIGRHWTRTSKTWDREIGARFSPKALVKAAASRPMHEQGGHDVLALSRTYESAFDMFSTVPADWPLSEIAELAVLLSVNSTKDAEFQSGSTPAFMHELKPAILSAAERKRPRFQRGFSRGLKRIIEARARLGLLSWGRYFQESLALLEARLRQHTYVNIVPTPLFLQERSRFWDRTCRFLGRVLMTSEVTVYRLRVAETGAPLELRGSFCEGPRGREKSEFKADFMHKAALDPEQRALSASYRAADKNQTQSAPDRDGALIPPSNEWAWGHSVLAVPIVNNGGVWGVLEFVADPPHQFGGLLAPQCEAAANLISSNLMIGSVFETLNKLDTYALLPPSTGSSGIDESRRVELGASLADVFNANSLKLFVATRDDQGRHFRVTEYCRWSATSAKPIEADDVEDVRSFLDDAEVQSKEVNREYDSSSPSGMTRSFLVRLGAEAANAWAGALWIAVPDTVDVDAVWTRNLFALAKVLAPSIANITSAHSWGPSSRRQIRHESGRVTNALEGIRTGLRTRILSKTRSEVERTLARLGSRDQEIVSGTLKEVWRSIDEAVSDLQGSIESMRLISKSLSYDVYDPLLVAPDPRVIAIQQSKEQYLKKSLQEVDLREAVISSMQTALRYASNRHLRLVVPPSSPRRLLKMDPNAVSAVLGTIAENAAKYSQRNSEILVAFRDLPDGSLRMIVSNLAPPLLANELETVFDSGVRGEAARRSHPTQGSGLGLGYARAAMELWDGFLDYVNDPVKTEKTVGVADSHTEPVVWHRLILTFPRWLVVS